MKQATLEGVVNQQIVVSGKHPLISRILAKTSDARTLQATDHPSYHRAILENT